AGGGSLSHERIKILMILNEDPFNPSGGLGVHVRHLCNELRKYDALDLTVLCVDYATQKGGLFIVAEDVESVDSDNWICRGNSFRVLKVFNTNDLVTRFGFITKMTTDDIFLENALSLLGGERFDVIHLHDANLWKVAKNLKVLWKAKIVLTCHLSFYLSHPAMPDNPFYIYDAQMEGTAFHKCSRLITVSDSYREIIKKGYFLDKPIDVIYNAVDFDFLSSVKYDKSLRRKYGNKPLVVFVGRLVPTKGIELILEAIRKLPDYHFVLIANISPTLEDVNPLVRRIKAMQGQYDNFHWLNYLDQDKKWRLMKVADMAIMPSLHEPFGITALEWMGLGVPLIVSKTGGLKEFCDEKNATPIDPNAEDLIEAIRNHKRSESKITRAIRTAETDNKGVFEEILGLEGIYLKLEDELFDSLINTSIEKAVLLDGSLETISRYLTDNKYIAGTVVK
ncbi:MAG: glycosyltransferase family 4 protein, partial [Planctomycetota bacterium]|nr:glycosyltransferase family 4 protein [Planctomycetota bacterium]